VHRAPTSCKTTPEPSTGHKAVAAVPQRHASCFERYNFAVGRDKLAVAQEANIVPSKLRRSMAQMLGGVVALLAMKQRRAPLPVSPTLLRSLWLRGFPESLAELEGFARRFLFLGDERMLLAELRRGPGSIASRQENSPGHSGIAEAQCTESESTQECHCVPTN
jgi:hypothetical protein